MSKNSPGRGFSPWMASLRSCDLPLEFFLRSGVPNIPVALVPSNGGSIRLNNPQATQENLHAVTPFYQAITDVRQFGRGGIVCRSPDQNCVADLLKCTSFANSPVSAFIPAHLACTKGIIRGVDSSLSAEQALEKFSAAGVIAVYRCNRVVENSRVPTESVIATFAGTTCPSEIKVWPLIFRVDPLAPRPLQCNNCWRFGHSSGGCKSNQRCCTCGEAHAQKDCTSNEARCCLCSGEHPANFSNCVARAQEQQVLDITDKRRCSRREAINIVKERAYGYAGVTAKNNLVPDSSLTAIIEAAVQKAVAKAMEQILANLGESISQAISDKMNNVLQTSSLFSPGPSGIISTASPKNIPEEQRGTHSSEKASASMSAAKGPSVSEDQSAEDLEMTDAEYIARAQKRAMPSSSDLLSK